MICDKCEVEMNLAETIKLNFTSPNFAELGFFRVPKQYRNVEKYICPLCGKTGYAPEMPQDDETTVEKE
ncbi:hypothetical protein SAMN02910353_02705 [Ruminococcus sp. YRD2003]|uniref:hypothetical protein n=1 Tax=Ruminococcus sp. YRD2003 TaxID=1452313 RepID=UPI0008CA624D|nr:hypothetical protein SAMN02910353_02705 [Ruminococcus flavefaciens]